MDVIQRLRDMMTERQWSEYRLAKEAQLSQSTISNIFHRNTIPSIPTLQTICDAFGISLFECLLSLMTYFKHLVSISGGTPISSFSRMLYSSEISLCFEIIRLEKKKIEVYIGKEEVKPPLFETDTIMIHMLPSNQ